MKGDSNSPLGVSPDISPEVSGCRPPKASGYSLRNAQKDFRGLSSKLGGSTQKNRSREMSAKNYAEAVPNAKCKKQPRRL